MARPFAALLSAKAFAGMRRVVIKLVAMKHTHDDRGGGEEFASVPDADYQLLALNKRHYDNTGLKSGQTKRQLGKQNEADPRIPGTLG